MISQPYLLHALSPLHAGTGHAADIIDLPIARMKATGIPFVPGSSIKGVLRDVRRPIEPVPAVDPEPKSNWLATFGPETNEADLHGGALAVGDARLLALPVRSFKGTFVWVTSPLLLRLAHRDLDLPQSLAIPQLPPGRSALASSATIGTCVHGGKLYLEDLDLPCTEDANLGAWSNRFADLVGRSMFEQRFAVVDDDTMTFLYETATQVDQRIRIDPKTRTVVEGALWLEESLPPETLLIGLMSADKGRKAGHTITPQGVIDLALPADAKVVQIGGKATVGRGRCKLHRLTGG